MNIQKILGSLACGETEILIFETLISFPEGASVVALAKRLLLPRPTIYGNLAGLIQKGLVRKGLRSEGGMFHVERTETIARLLDEKTVEFQRAKSSLRDVLAAPDTTVEHKPRFIVYEGMDAYARIFRDILRSKEKEIYWVWPLSDMVKWIPEQTFFDFHTERVSQGMWLNVLWPQSKKMSLKKHPLLFPKEEGTSLRRIRLLPKNIEQSIGYGIYGTKVAFLSSNQENYAFVIDSAELSHTFKNLFDFLWSVSAK